MYPDVFQDMNKKICPVEGTKLTTKKGVSFVDIISGDAKGNWTCLTCDKLGSAGCYNEFNALKGQKKAKQYVSLDSIATPAEKKQVRKDVNNVLDGINNLLKLG